MTTLLRPIIALNAWTFLIEGWMYATRIPVFSKLKIAADNTITRSDLDKKTPAAVRWKSDNYSNLFEQPTQFYAVALVLAVARASAAGPGAGAGAGAGNALDSRLAWTYVGLRVLHSLVHCTRNRVLVRFGCYVASSGVLAVLTARAAMVVFV